MKTLSSKIMMLLLSGSLAMASCKKDDNSESNPNNSSQATMDVMLTDAPGDYEKVYVDIQAVEANIEGKGWVKLALFRPGVYNLLEFRNGVDTMIASQPVPAGELNEIRLILGSRNSVVIAGVSYDLETPSAQQSGLKIKIKESIRVGVKYTVWVDFDANKSIVVTGSGKYILKPVLRAFLKYNTGSLKGDVNPDDAVFFINAITSSNMDTFTTFPFIGGRFLYLGLPEGSYHVHFYNRAGADIRRVNDVMISKNNTTDMGDINF